VNEFVEECRSEWKRLGVPDSVANEMAADLAADLEEAEAEGASAEDVLGSSAFDPRSFATDWAAERGLIQRPPPNGHGLPSRSRLVAAIGACTLIAIGGAVLLILVSPSVPERLALAAPVVPPPGPVAVVLPPPPAELPATGDGVSLPAPTTMVISPDGMVALRAPSTRIVAVDVDDSRVDTRTVGWVLLTVGLAGVVPAMLFWIWVGPGRWSRRPTHGGDRPRERA
jgi:hypothetical protein